ncbi:hypothetical protein NRK67_00680 [Fusobacteria bacterium ZRK30]|nr:hypothetical protein NRK67_00680 [Fusobacteria bacterium ZRK30]
MKSSISKFCLMDEKFNREDEIPSKKMEMDLNVQMWLNSEDKTCKVSVTLLGKINKKIMFDYSGTYLFEYLCNQKFEDVDLNVKNKTLFSKVYNEKLKKRLGETLVFSGIGGVELPKM